jgi:chemotaxis protein MotB
MTARTPGVGTRAQERWMVSYVDVLTILLIFFLAAAANKFKASQEVRPEPQVALPKAKTPRPAAGSTLAQVEQALSREELSLKLEPRGLTISLPQAILFFPGDDKIHPTALPTLEKIATAIREVPNKINLAGYADDRPIHNPRFRNNWDLAAARSLRLMELLIKKYGVDESRFSVSSYGSNDPRSPNDTAEGRAANRRVEILLSADYNADGRGAQSTQ